MMKFNPDQWFKLYLRYRLKEGRKRKHHNQTWVASQVGVKPAYISKFISLKNTQTGKDETRRAIIEALEDTYEAAYEIGMRLSRGKTMDPRAVIAQPERPLVVVNTLSEKDIDTDLYRAVPLYESGRLAAWANGASFDPYEKVSSQVLVYQPELKHRAKHSLKAVRVGGDSMKPVIPEGAIVIVDLDDRDFADRKIFVVCVEDDGSLSAAVKRVRRIEGGFVLLSENTEYLPEVVMKDWYQICVGRVVWMWRDMQEA